MTGGGTRRTQPVLVAGSIALAVSAAGAAITDIGPWYRALKRPPWQPPDWLFGPVWTTIFLLGTVAAVLAWRRAGDARSLRRVVVLFGVNIVFNLLWSTLFFRLQRPDFALIEVGLLWLSILALIAGLWGLSRGASLALLPYLAWVAFAAVLNFEIVRLNAPFAAGPAAGVPSQHPT